MDRLDYALQAQELGYELVCVRPGTKAARFRNWPELIRAYQNAIRRRTGAT